MIKIEKLSKSYGRKKILNEIDLELIDGKIYGFVGRNGAGKTTFFNCLSGFCSYQGKVKSDYEVLKNHIGFLPTIPYILPKITGWEYLKLLVDARGIKEEEFERRNIFDLPLDQYVETYSTGMVKKLALMGILLQKNEIYILDEPFNGVDIHSNMLILELIYKLKELGKTVLISSHIFATLSECCDEIRLLENGRFGEAVGKDDFSLLENEMKDYSIGNKIEQLLSK